MPVLLLKRQHYLNRLLCLFLISILNPAIVASNSGYKYLSNYSKSDYDHHPQNFCITQDANNLIFVGNRGGILEYDGASWRLISLSNLLARSLAVDETNTLYVGGSNEIGYLSPNPTGSLQFKPITDQLEEKYRNFNSIHQAIVVPGGIYFRASEYLFFWNYKKFKTWESVSKFLAIYYLEGKLFIQQRSTGLQVLQNNSFQDIPGGTFFSDRQEAKKIALMVIYDRNPTTFLIGTKAAGLFLYDGNHVSSFSTDVDHLFTNERNLLHGIRLTSGKFALATKNAGLIIIDSKGKSKHIYDKTTGLQDHDVKYIYQEPSGNIWLALNNGISKIEYDSPFTIYDSRSQLFGTVLAIIKHERSKTYYIGTTEGLYRLLPSGIIQLIPGNSRICWALHSMGDTIIAATDSGLFELKNNTLHLIDSKQSFRLTGSLQNPNQIWVAAKDMLISCLKSEPSTHWKVSTYNLNFTPLSLLEEPDGTLWLGTGSKGVFSISAPGTPGQQIRNYTGEHNLPIEENGSIQEIDVVRIANQTIFITKHGLYRYDKDKDRFFPYPILGKTHSGDIDFNDGNQPIFRIAEDPKGTLWFHSNSINYQAVRQANGTYQIARNYLPRIPITQVNYIYPESGVVWFGAYDSLIRYETGFHSNQKKTLPIPYILPKK